MRRRARGEGTLHLRKDGRWEGKLRAPVAAGMSERRSFYGQTRQAVAEQMRRYLARDRTVVDLDLSLEDYLSGWLRDGEWRPNTFRLRKLAIERHIVPHVGARRVVDLDVDDLKALFRKLKQLDVGPATRRQVHATLTAALNVLYRERKILFNPCSLIPAPRYEPKDKVVLDRHQVKRLIEAAGGQTQVLVTMAATLAMREGELLGLLWECVDLERRTVAVVRQLTVGADGKPCLSMLKTKASRRTLQLPELAARVLKAWHDRSGDGPRSAFVFTDREGNPLRKSNFIRRDFKPLLRRAGLPDVDFHSLRHSSNSLLIEEGADPILVARRNGHASTRMVLDRYGHLFEGARRQAAETMDRIFSGVEIGRQMVVKNESSQTRAPAAIPKSLAKSAHFLVEMRGLEPLTP
ncbi:MAG: tyrosine-type recombinase/integrase, partial [Candidatus Cybelea sp.]